VHRRPVRWRDLQSAIRLRFASQSIVVSARTPENVDSLADFDYALPEELIAQTPATQRSASRLLHVARDRLSDLAFVDLPSLIAPGDLMVFNDTRVLRARVHGRRSTGGRIELMLERVIADDEAWVQLRASHLPKPGGVLELPGGARAEVLARDDRMFRVRFDSAVPLLEWLERHGEVPLPPYIAHAGNDDDAERYQTVYAKNPGAVAAPTAGLHFDAAMLDALDRRGVERAFLTLHVGAGTFQPVQSARLEEHRMHSERYRIPAETATAIAAARTRGARVIAIGTTTLRALESAAVETGRVHAGEGETALFIRPGFRFRVVDRLVTNFHLPRSTLLMLVSAFAGTAAIRRAYAHAIAARYRFYSYGDAMLLDPASAT
jgi:S-adenosylmethionine:tRNA ribosyltransferase-isomerase